MFWRTDRKDKHRERAGRLGWLLLPILLAVSLSGCDGWREEGVPDEADGYRPVYMSTDEIRAVNYEPPRPMANPGKIMTYGVYLMVVEKGKGVHVIDNQNPNNPQPVGFITISGCTELHFRSPILYSNNHNDLISVDLSEFDKPVVKQRLTGAFPSGNDELNYPPALDQERTYFECVDPAKGKVVGWKRDRIKKPKCYR